MDQDTVDRGRNAPRLSGRRAAMVGATGLLIALYGSFDVHAKSTSPNTEAVTQADYTDPAHWLCRPGRADACAANLDATIIAADGSMTHEAYHADPDAPIDCFYVYPTVSHEPTGNADWAIDSDITFVAVQQFARFGARCRLFAPVYRQITIPALMPICRGSRYLWNCNLGYSDVLAAWRNYIANDNHGRGFVLVGHSQGAGVLARLVREEIDGKPIQAQLVSALLIGGALGDVRVKTGDAPVSRFLTFRFAARTRILVASSASSRSARKLRRTPDHYLRRRLREPIRFAPIQRRWRAARGPSMPICRLRAGTSRSPSRKPPSYGPTRRIRLRRRSLKFPAY